MQLNQLATRLSEVLPQMVLKSDTAPAEIEQRQRAPTTDQKRTQDA